MSPESSSRRPGRSRGSRGTRVAVVNENWWLAASALPAVSDTARAVLTVTVYWRRGGQRRGRRDRRRLVGRVIGDGAVDQGAARTAQLQVRGVMVPAAMASLNRTVIGAFIATSVAPAGRGRGGHRRRGGVRARGRVDGELRVPPAGRRRTSPARCRTAVSCAPRALVGRAGVEAHVVVAVGVVHEPVRGVGRQRRGDTAGCSTSWRSACPRRWWPPEHRASRSSRRRWRAGTGCSAPPARRFMYTDIDVTVDGVGPVTNREPFMWFMSPVSVAPRPGCSRSVAASARPCRSRCTSSPRWAR